MAAVHMHGGSVPIDFRVTGFDDVGFSALASPTLTTIHQPVHEMTEMIMEIIRVSFDGGGQSDNVVRRFKPSLVVRESSPAASRL